ncbi:hypothetical protein GALMADRAFT_80035, partial [Galerina marginata CBS 339.88]
LNDCLCGDVVQPFADGAVKCKQAGCETEWYHLACIGEDQAQRNWVCAACEVAHAGRADDIILPYLVLCLIT